MSDASQTEIANVQVLQPKGPSDSGSYFGGTKPLWKAFWLVFVFGNLTVAIVTATISSVAMAISVAPAPLFLFNPYHVAYFNTSLSGLYFVYSAIVLWRCAATASSYGLRYGVRIFLGLCSSWWLYGLVSFLSFVMVRLYG